MEQNGWVLAIILGAVQGLSEFLPISSSAHLIIFSWFLSGKPLPMVLNIAMHVGTLSSLLLFFWADWMEIGRSVVARISKGQRSFQSDALFPGLVIGSIPAAVVGLLGKDYIEEYFHSPAMVVVPLILVGFVLWWVDRTHPQANSLQGMSVKKSWYIGLAQTLALIPGVSRSGITIIAARTMDFDRAAAARFSFLLGTPALFGAALLHGRQISEHIQEPIFYGGIISSCVVGCIAIKFFIAFIQRYGFLAFALYRLALGVALVLVAFWQKF
jgi:undecaprenyl-diphosphatase